ncbi:MAG: hypothetical protein BJ554DRAFT_6513 [Olpidium bornovanus]|uniref:DOCKER Lobe A domain-containing protein n=1 Tax=Olpidium bornovanus TaxID=278681 RepID=A0A8H7ZXS0_9FUNG|nr:MAG: hypothetical protein BJ554DRAFT_6513 [Olpidium bornovanus]
MVSDYLVAIREPGYCGPAGTAAFRQCSPSLVPGAAFTEQKLREEGVCQSASFSEKGLIELLDKAFGLFRKVCRAARRDGRGADRH